MLNKRDRTPDAGLVFLAQHRTPVWDGISQTTAETFAVSAPDNTLASLLLERFPGSAVLRAIARSSLPFDSKGLTASEFARAIGKFGNPRLISKWTSALASQPRSRRTQLLSAALWSAAESDQSANVHALLKAGGRATFELTAAALHRSESIALRLIPALSTPELCKHDPHDRTLLDFAVASGHVSAIRSLCKRRPLSKWPHTEYLGIATARNDEGLGELQRLGWPGGWELAFLTSEDPCEWLAHAGTDPYRFKGSEWSPLLVTLLSEHTRTLKRIVDRWPANSAARRGALDEAIHHTVTLGKRRSLKVLHALGISLDRRLSYCGATPLAIAIEYGHSDVVRDLLRLGVSPSRPTYTKSRPLHLACVARSDQRLGLVQTLLRAAPHTIHSRDSDGLTPLQIAKLTGSVEVVLTLLRALNSTPADRRRTV